MKRTKTLLGAIGITAVAAGVLMVSETSSSASRKYTQKEFMSKSDIKASWNEAAKLHFDLRKDPVTGEIDEAALAVAKEQVRMMNMEKSANFTLINEGPDNVGGRTRALIVDPNQDLIVYAGGVDGGIFKSVDGGNLWIKVQAWDDLGVTMSISSMVMTKAGKLYVATGGSAFEGGLSGEGSGVQDGDGIWTSTDGGATFTQIAATAGWNVNKLAADLSGGDKVWVAASSSDGGLVVLDNEVPTEVPSQNGAAYDVKCSPNGQVIISNAANKTYLSTDGGANFTDLHGGGILSDGGNARWEYAVSYETNASGKYSLFAVSAGGNGKIRGVWHSEDNGESWYEIAPASTTGWEPLTSRNGQGLYDLVIDCVPGEPDNCILGGIDLWRWNKTPGNDPSNGQWGRISFWAMNPSSPLYVHADNHRITWDSQGRMFVGNDGGVQISLDNTTSLFTTANRGYGVTQAYAIGYGPDGTVVCGTQDNGTQYNAHTGFSYAEHIEINGGDGFECEISHLNPEAVISSVYNASISRSEDRGSNWSSAAPPCGSLTVGEDCGQFYTSMRLFENEMDMNTQDSIEFIPTESMSAGDTANYYSLSFNIPLEFELTQDLTVNWDSIQIGAEDSITPTYDTLPAGSWHYYNPVAQDTIMLPDYVQSLFVTQGEFIYLTRDMMRYGSTTEWWQLDIPNGMQSYEFSKDGNTLWAGTWSGALYRITNLNQCYSEEHIDVAFKDSASYMVEIDQVTSFGQVITDISVDPNDPDNVAVTIGGGGGVRVSSNGTSANPSFSNKLGNLPSMPYFGVEILANSNGQKAVVGGEYGLFYTDDITASSPSWTAQNDEIGLVPVFDVRQEWRSFGGHVSAPEKLYIGTHGRGLWSTGDLVTSVEDHNPIEITKPALSGVKVYPNPLQGEGKLAFEIGQRTDVEVKIYSITGKQMHAFTWKNMNAGSHAMDLGTDLLPTGTYIITMKAGTVNEVTKFIKY